MFYVSEPGLTAYPKYRTDRYLTKLALTTEFDLTEVSDEDFRKLRRDLKSRIFGSELGGRGNLLLAFCGAANAAFAGNYDTNNHFVAHFPTDDAAYDQAIRFADKLAPYLKMISGGHLRSPTVYAGYKRYEEQPDGRRLHTETAQGYRTGPYHQRLSWEAKPWGLITVSCSTGVYRHKKLLRNMLYDCSETGPEHTKDLLDILDTRPTIRATRRIQSNAPMGEGSIWHHPNLEVNYLTTFEFV